ncbi:pentatricopeptide repeat-containing protein [Quercus suber]|uniref:Pentatricopeptide repeat-containing protein n=1 Tax=Quercus suber TaxID=58331 RepID=A0AAW0IY15_QUESU
MWNLNSITFQPKKKKSTRAVFVKYMKSITNFNHFSVPKPLQHRLTPKQSILDQLKTCSNLKNVGSVFASMIKTSTNQDCFLVNQFISACSNFLRIDYAILAFTHMENPNVFVYNAMIRGFVHCFHPTQALECYIHMLRAEVMPTSYMFSSLIKACASLSALGFGEAVHCHIWRNGFHSHVFVQTALIDFYSNFGKIGRSRRVFDEMPDRDNGFDVDVYIGSALIDMYAKCGSLDRSLSVFFKLWEKNLFCWNSVIDGLAVHGYADEALKMFRGMEREKIKPNGITFISVLSACTHAGLVEEGRRMF